MKRFTALFLLLVLLAFSAAADPVILSGMSFDELVALRDQLNLAIWNSQEWQEVTVPAGVWIVGEDIPAGRWIIKPTDRNIAYIIYCEALDDTGYSYKSRSKHFSKTIISETHHQHDDSYNFLDLEMVDRWFFITDSTVIFTPYTGKPDLGFR